MKPLTLNLPFTDELDLLYPIYGHYVSWPAYRLYGGHLALDGSALAIHGVTSSTGCTTTYTSPNRPK